MEFPNLSNLSVDSSGRASFSGLSSGIDIQKIVGDIIAAKRIPVDTIETRIAANADRVTALADLRALVTGLRQAVSGLRGAVTFGATGNAFAAKQVFATTSRADGSPPSAAANLVGASVTNAAQVGSHTIEVLRVAAAHKVASQTFASQTSALGLAGSFEVAGSGGKATITVVATDTLQDVRDRIINANTGASATGMTASIVQASTTEFVLVLTSDKTGVSMTVTDSGTVLSGLGISATNGTGGFRNGLAASKIAPADGFAKILFDGTQGDQAFLISYDQATRVMTLTRGDGTTDTATLASGAIAAGQTETVTFADFGATIVLDPNFDKASGIVVDADAASVTGGTGAIDAGTIKISASQGNVSGIASNTLTFGSLATPGAISVSVGAFSGTFDGTGTGLKTVTLSDGGGNSLSVQFNVTAVFDGNESAASIDLQELENLVVSSGTRFSNEIQKPQTARLTADGLIDADRFESRFVATRTATLSSLAPQAGAPGSFDIKVGAGTVTVNYLGTDTIEGLVTKINDAITAAGGGNAVFDAGTAASLMTDGTGVRLVLTNTSGAAITLTDTNGLMAGLGVDNELVLERQSNTVSDLFGGMTLTLFQGEEGTKIKFDVERNLGSAKTAIQGFVTAYNDLKAFLNEQSLVDSTTGKKTDATGILFGAAAVVGTTSRLSSVFAQVTQGINDAFATLRQIGITFVDNESVTDPLLRNTLEIDETKLDEALLNNPDDVRRLFAFDFSSSDPRVSLLGFTGKSSYAASGYTLNINFDDRFHSQAYTEGGAFTLSNATSGGPAQHGIGAVTFDNSVVSGKAYRYSYDSATEQLTLVDLTAGTSESVAVTGILNAIGNGGDLDPGESAQVSFSALKATVTLTGDGATPFQRGVSVITTGAQTVTTTGDVTVTGSATAVNDQDGGVTQAGVDDLMTNVASYAAATGILTINTNSAAPGDLTLAATAGLEFSVDGGGFAPAPATNLDDGGIHTVDVRLAATGEVLGRITLDNVDGTGAGAGTLAFDVGNGLIGETSNVIDLNAPMENYLTFSNGSFEVRDASNNLLGTVNYNTTDSLTTLASNITAAIPNVSASVIDGGTTIKLEVLHSTRQVLNFTGDTGGLIAQLNIANGGDGVFSANIDGAAGGADNLSVTVSGRTITATSLTGADGLKIFYDGTGDLNAIGLNFTVGFGARLFAELDELLTPVSGLIESNINALNEQNDFNQARADAMVARLETTRASLLQQFINMETALARAKTLQENLTQTFDAMFANKSR